MQIKNPKFGNIWSIDTKVKTDHSSGGTLLQVVDPQWPVVQMFDITFENLSIPQKDALENYLVNNAGYELTITDLENRTWIGVFTSDPIIFTLEGRDCKWSVKLSFEGTVTDYP